MRHLLLALPFALLPLAMVHAAEVEHASLGAHEHGVARLDIALDGKSLEFELDSPSMNIVGFEHEASTDTDKAKLANARELLLKSQALFNLPLAAKCAVTTQKLQSPLFGDKPDAADDHNDDNDTHAQAEAGETDHHSEIHAHYVFVCDAPSALKSFDLSQIFKTFPNTHRIQVQLIAPSGQLGTEATPDNATLKF
ncbi:DUF2796 domain-containing protein [Pseudomonas sp. 10B1]|uniref:DUF2796 domain-containing protein n=1 Tax=unclassified Pseudomonas TaxID=196821 RepID=UPI002AB3CB52|nr:MULTISPECIES: DUF2796 domain-containing protein [unclassified Pseudomonas]MDY7562067.1 DUF2796 domain-containing protein [Pseudomonas sp. AB6]MEA9993590.1 DUF2796 domain-containing protein [Pseudomonas sp. AA4]MEB0087089.1 DUF2796 domain-containing protein [Pseudomonas sp. RTI1]MEB0126137.1 DUF2796 domain-containing protein [Pseudomonas sp. CCC1.2]MEB0153372.1 DUF2796 domain-containing protein [Pseudomonas sp. CCC4.3]